MALFFRFIHGMAASISGIISNYNTLTKAYSLAVSFVKQDQVVISLGALEFGWSNNILFIINYYKLIF